MADLGSIDRPTIGDVPSSAVTHKAAITIRTADGKAKITALPSATDPTMTDGRGGWTEVSRPRRPAIIEWTGPTARKAHVDLILDAWIAGGSVEPQIAVIDVLAPQAPTVEPPAVYVTGAPGIPPSVPWVVTAVSFTERLRREDGVLELARYR